MQLHYNTIAETGLPGAKWKNLFDAYWPAYRAWLDTKGAAYFPDLPTSQAALKKYMPKMWPTYERLCKLTNGDPVAAKFLTGFQPPAYISACSQAVINEGEIQLVRNYDYHPDLAEGTLLMSAWNGKKVIATSDCLIGAVDGMNENGLTISLTFGGRKEVGTGFGIPFILRYVLEFCSNVEEAVAVLIAIPSHMSYNVTVVDATGNFKTVLLSPDREPKVTIAMFTTNHQLTVDWPENASFNQTLKRSSFLENLLNEKELPALEMANAFLKPPLYNTLFDQGFGTLYTAVYQPEARTVQMRWPQDEITVSFTEFIEVRKLIKFNQPTEVAVPELELVGYGTETSNAASEWQANTAEILVNNLGLYALPEEKEDPKNVREKIIHKGEISWELVADYWANVGKSYWKKWQK